ncbi:MAG: EVE domain-containing protein [Proteobacteria bacterium]|nr:EVE domain-containing protein [Pseudomonadota bacterium]
MKYWLMKTEPDVFGWNDLETNPNQTASWDGVRNYQARNSMRDDFKLGDRVFVYHSSCETPGIAGLAEVVKEAYPDPTALDPKSEYYDPKSEKLGASRWVMVNVKSIAKAKSFLPLNQIRSHKKLQNMLLLRPGQRLSIQAVTDDEAAEILKLLGL